MSSKHFPRFMDKVNDTRRKHANGFVMKVLYDDGPDEVIVRFDDRTEAYDFDDFRSTWTDDYGGVFVLVNHPDATAIDDIQKLLKALNL